MFRVLESARYSVVNFIFSNTVDVWKNSLTLDMPAFFCISRGLSVDFYFLSVVLLTFGRIVCLRTLLSLPFTKVVTKKLHDTALGFLKQRHSCSQCLKRKPVHNIYQCLLGMFNFENLEV